MLLAGLCSRATTVSVTTAVTFAHLRPHDGGSAEVPHDGGKSDCTPGYVPGAMYLHMRHARASQGPPFAKVRPRCSSARWHRQCKLPALSASLLFTLALLKKDQPTTGGAQPKVPPPSPIKVHARERAKSKDETPRRQGTTTRPRIQVPSTLGVLDFIYTTSCKAYRNIALRKFTSIYPLAR